MDSFEFHPRENILLIFQIWTVVWLNVMRNWPAFHQTRLSWQNWIIYYTNLKSSSWDDSNDVYILGLLIKSNETTISGQLWPLYLTESGQNDIDGQHTIQLRNPHVKAILMMCISCDFWWNSMKRPLVVSCDHCFWPKVVKTI